MTHFELYENVTSPVDDFRLTEGDADTIAVLLGRAFSLRHPEAHIQVYATLDDGAEVSAAWGSDDLFDTWLCLKAEDCDLVLRLLATGMSAEHPATTT